jgi:ABC-type transport system substrate-binding protein
MKSMLRSALAASAVLLTISVSGMAFAQKQGGILKMYTPDSPASMSIHEEATVFSQGPMMGVFNNLVVFDQHVKQNSLEAIVPDLASGWSWNEEGTELKNPALAQKQGGVLRLSHFDSPASMSILEESTRAAEQPMMHVFNNLIMYKQDVAQTSLQTIVPDLARSWSWSEDGNGIDLPAAPGGQMARRQAVHRQ